MGYKLLDIILKSAFTSLCYKSTTALRQVEIYLLSTSVDNVTNFCEKLGKIVTYELITNIYTACTFVKQNKSISCLYLKLQDLKIVALWNSRGCCIFLPTSWTFGFYNKSDVLLTVKNHQLAIQICQFNTLRLPNALSTQVGFVGVTAKQAM